MPYALSGARCTLAVLAMMSCSQAYALTLECKMGVAYGTKVGPRQTYTLTVNERDNFVMGNSAGVSRKIPIVSRIETAEMKALTLDNGEPTVRATLILSPGRPRLELKLGGGDTVSQTDLCDIANPQ